VIHVNLLIKEVAEGGAQMRIQNEVCRSVWELW